MKLVSLERVPDGEHALIAFCVGEYLTAEGVFFDVLYHREALVPGTYTVTADGIRFSFALPSEAAEQGMPGVLYNVQADLRE